MTDKHRLPYIDKRSYQSKAALESKHPPKLTVLPPAILVSCYLASAAIAVLCGVEARSLITQGDTQTGSLYILLAVVGVLASVFITWRQSAAKKQLALSKSAKKAARKK